MSEPSSPETPPIPEAPKKGFNVEVRQPEMLYKMAQNIVGGVETKRNPFGDRVSETQIDDQVFEREYTTLSGFESNWGEKSIGRPSRVDNTFFYKTRLVLSPEMTSGQLHGFFGEEKVKDIAQRLVQKGIRAKVDEYFLAEDKGCIKIERDGNFFEVFFGYTSKEAEENTIREQARLNPDGYDATYEIPRIEKEGVVNEAISLDVVDQVRHETSMEGYPKLGDENSFKRLTNTYTEIYKQVITTIYEEEGKNPPDKTVVFRPPIKNSDAFTQISSSSTETPIAVTSEQLKTEAIGFDDIAGQDGAVAEARRLVLAINHPEVFEKRGVKRPKGILFYGPPGTGKTLIAKAVAKEANAEFLQISAADIGTKWYGESERLMQEVFNIANKSVSEGKKVVLFFDEIDSLAPSREDSHEATRKVVATLLQNMDGMKANPNVTVVAATNRPQDIDPALKPLLPYLQQKEDQLF